MHWTWSGTRSPASSPTPTSPRWGPTTRSATLSRLDSLDFLSFVEVLSDRSGVRIEDEDTPQLSTLSRSADFLVAHTR